MGVIDFQRKAWASFLPRMEHNYEVRRKQHFSILEQYPTHNPVARRFYEQPWVIDAGTDMYNRLMNKEKNVVSLLDFGWKTVDQRMIPPDTLWEFFEAFHAGIQSLYISRGMSYDDLPIHAIQFVRMNKTGDVLEDNKFVRVGVDEVPDPDSWRLALGDDDGVIDIPLPLFSVVYSHNRPPMNPVMFDHDGSHVIDYLNNPKYYNKQQEMFARICGRHPHRSRLNISECPDSGNPYTTYGRVCCLHEETCLPDISKSGAIHYALEIATGLRDYKARGRFLARCVPRLVIRHGGGMNDPYNLHNDLNIRTVPQQRVEEQIRDPTKRFFHNTGRELFSQLAVESMLGLVSDIEYLSECSGFVYERMLVDKIKRLETALETGVALKIAIDKFISETAEQFVDPDCDSYKWLASFMPKHSLHGEFYLSSNAIGC